jgi:adenylate cyclase
MGVEIERKFLVCSDAWRQQVSHVVRMAQGYLNDVESVDSGRQRASVRVRIAGEQAFLNIKSRELGHTRQEFDYAVPLADAQALLALCVGGLVDKRRHHVRVGAHLWEVDEFLGDNAGLVVVEIELGHADEDFERPGWLGREVTDEARYYNLALASRPYSAWSAGERN